MNPSRPTITLFATGGTISSISQGKKGYVPALSGADLLAKTQGYKGIAEIRVNDFSHKGSNDMTPRNVCNLANQVLNDLRTTTFVGAVITHGTGSLEESAFLMDLFAGEKPIVFTGSVVSADSTRWDGGRNLLDSIATAVSPEARGRGALVCCDGEIHLARHVVKLSEVKCRVFYSPGRRPVGYVRRGKVSFSSPPVARMRLKHIAIDPRVEVLKICQGSGTSLISAALQLGYRGIVLEGLSGGGSLPSSFLPVIRDGLAKGVPLVLSTRSLEGEVKYEGPADMIALGETGIISAGALPSHKARLLLMAALCQSKDLIQIRELFRAYLSSA